MFNRSRTAFTIRLSAAVLGITAITAGVLLTACSPSDRNAASTAAPASVTIARPDLKANKPVEHPGIHQLVAYAPGVYSGAAPEGAAAFESLRAMGFKTIISVDGAQPEVDAAAAQGLRYVHLPIQYSGISEERSLEIARAVRDLPGPVYIHCHHGKHRSAAAAGVAAVSLSLCTPEAAIERMRVSGTGANYTGLFAVVRESAPVSKQQLDAANAEFPSASKPKGIVQAMVEIDLISEHLSDIEKAGWQTPADHPDLVPAAEVGRLADLFRDLLKDPSTTSRDAEYARLMTASHAASVKLEELITSLSKGQAPDQSQRDALSKQAKILAASCKDCHAKYRD
ncbi:MAG: hypothetical protein IBJ18_11335 [Phycisphaerales bacterium]|nr:hypothetical protein [Phycisphaerales bacterium]